MTDKEIIESFLNNDQMGIRKAYYAWRMPFDQSILRLLPNDEDRADAYQEAFIRLQQHILTERLTADNIQKSILAYFKTIGRYVALEIINQRNKGQNHTDEENDIDTINIKEELEFSDEPMDDEPLSSDQSFDPNDDMDTQERERIIRSLVEQLGKPCAPLLLGHLWENKSMEILAQELGYSNADSAKSQKAKCMNKVKTFVKQQLIEYGYGYR
jgi:RNA polymerase sigma factor (sigma-70 family)